MQHRWILGGLLFVAALVVVSWISARNRRTPVVDLPHITRVDGAVFVCCNNRGDYSPGVYLNDPEGGEPSLLDIVQQAAPYMRGPEPGDAAAGLCGYLFKQLGNDTAAGAAISLFETPRPRPDGRIDWQSYCGGSVDVVLINVERGKAEVYSSGGSENAPKTVIASKGGLRFGR
jgi:hypothetical protein